MAVALLRRHVDGALSAGAFAQLLAWLDQLGDATVLSHPDLAGYKAWLLYMRGRVTEAERYARRGGLCAKGLTRISCWPIPARSRCGWRGFILPGHR
ncbi:hypothetical protein [Metarhizobium album]|uniref:hypothetical protein n=1 Tax=Metarhizobium album TaxID=2182425 RepID=UPI000FFF341F|nr:hypothetical protein [Rhizobium album]